MHVCAAVSDHAAMAEAMFDHLSLPLPQPSTSLWIHRLWRIRTDQLGPWKGLDTQFTQDEQQVKATSATTVLRDGASTLFRKERWLGVRRSQRSHPPMWRSFPPELVRARRSERPSKTGDGSPTFKVTWARWLCAIHCALEEVLRCALLGEPYALLWHWMQDSQFSSRSC
jgi:hypothetical protein